MGCLRGRAPDSSHTGAHTCPQGTPLPPQSLTGEAEGRHRVPNLPIKHDLTEKPHIDTYERRDPIAQEVMFQINLNLSQHARAHQTDRVSQHDLCAKTPQKPSNIRRVPHHTTYMHTCKGQCSTMPSCMQQARVRVCGVLWMHACVCRTCICRK
jgi:hypothetical protein